MANLSGLQEDLKRYETGTYNPQTTSPVEEKLSPLDADLKAYVEEGLPDYKRDLEGVPMGIGDEFVNYVEGKKQYTKSQIEGMVDWYQRNNIEDGVDYTKDGVDPATKFEFNLMDTPEEKESYLDSKFGIGGWRTDKGGRYIIKDRESGKETVLNKPGFTPSDLLDPNMIGSTIGAIGGSFAGAGLGFLGRVGSEVAGSMAGWSAAEGVESLLGYNKEDINEIFGRGTTEAGWQTTFTLLSSAPSFIVSKIKNPLGGGVTTDSRQAVRDFEEWNNKRMVEGKSHVTPRTSALNEAPFLARFEGILSKFPGSAGLYKENDRKFKEAIESDIKELVGDSPDADLLGQKMRETFKQAMDAKINHEASIRNIRWNGSVDFLEGGKNLKMGVDKVVEDFKLRAEATEGRLRTMLGNPNARIIDIRPLKDAVRKEINKTVKTATGQTVEMFNPGIAVSHMQQTLDLPDFVTFEKARSMRTALGDRVGGRSTTEGISEGQAKNFYGILSNSLKDANGIAQRAGLKGDEAKKFVKEFSEYNSWYSDRHGLLNDQGSPIREIAKRYDPSELPIYFFAHNQANKVDIIRNTIPAKNFEKFRETSMDMLFRNKTGKQLVAAIDGIGMDVMESTFGKAKAQDIYEFAKASKALQDVPLSKFVTDNRYMEDILQRSVVKGKPSSVRIAKEFLGKDWGEFQVYFGSLLYKDALDSNRVFDGNALQNAIEKKWGRDVVEKVFEGTDFVANIERLGRLSAVQKKAEKSEVGGLIAGGFIAGMATIGLGKVLAYTVGSNMTARALISPSAQKWLTREPLSQMSSATLRAATHTMANMSRSYLENTEEPKFQATDIDPDKLLKEWYEASINARMAQ